MPSSNLSHPNSWPREVTNLLRGYQIEFDAAIRRPWADSTVVLDELTTQVLKELEVLCESPGQTDEFYDWCDGGLDWLELEKFMRKFLEGNFFKEAVVKPVFFPARNTGKPDDPNRTNPKKPDCTIKYEEPNSYFTGLRDKHGDKFPANIFNPGGYFIDPETGDDLTGTSYGIGSIDVSSGRPITSFDLEPQASPYGRTHKVNLSKYMKWHWVSTPIPNVKDIISVKVDGDHFYTLHIDMAGAVALATYPNETNEPKGKPTVKGKMELGSVIGKIRTKGNEHPLYDKISIVPQLEPTTRKPANPAKARGKPAKAESTMKLSDSKFIRRSMEERTTVKPRGQFQGTEAASLRGIFDKQHREARMMFPEASGSYEAVSFHDPDNGLRRYGYVIGEGQHGTARVELGDGEYMDVPHDELRPLGGERASSHLRMQLRAAFGGVSTDTNGLRADMHDRFAPLAVDPSNSIELLSVGYSSSVGMPTDSEIGSYVAHFHPTARLLDVDDSMPGLLGLSVQRFAEHEVEAEMGPAAGGEVTQVFDPKDADDYEGGMEVEAADDDLEDACWVNYKAVGLKEGRGGNPVPNCVPEKSGAGEGRVGPKGRPAARMSDAALADFHKVAPPHRGQVRQAQVFKNILQGIKDVVNRTRTRQPGFPSDDPDDYATMAQALLKGTMNEQSAYILRKYFETGGSRAGSKFLQNPSIDEQTKLALLSAALQNYERIDRRGYEALASKLLPGFRGQDQSGQGAAGGLTQKRKQELREEHPVITEQFTEAIKVGLQSAMQQAGGVDAYKLADFSQNIKKQLDAAVKSATENYGWDEADIYKQVQQTFTELRAQPPKTQSRADYDEYISDQLEQMAHNAIESGQGMPSMQYLKPQLANALQLGYRDSLENYGWSDQRLQDEFMRTYAEVFENKKQSILPMATNELTQLGQFLLNPQSINDPRAQALVKKYKLQNKTDPQMLRHEIQRLLSNPNEVLRRFLRP